MLQPITCWSSCTDCAESTVFQFFPLFHARRAQSTEQSRARARRSHRKPRRARTWRPQLQTASNKYEIISPLWVAGHLSGRHSRSALPGLSEARKSRRCGSNYPGPGIIGGWWPGCVLLPLVTRSRWHRNKSMCVGTRKILFDQFSFKYFLLKPSIKIDYQYVASGYMGLKVRLNESWVPISILEFYLVDRDLAWGRHILCLDVFCGLLCYSYSDIHVVVIQEMAFFYV